MPAPPLQNISKQGEVLDLVYRACISMRLMDAQQRGSAPPGTTLAALSADSTIALGALQALHESECPAAPC